MVTAPVKLMLSWGGKFPLGTRICVGSANRICVGSKKDISVGSANQVNFGKQESVNHDEAQKFLRHHLIIIICQFHILQFKIQSISFRCNWHLEFMHPWIDLKMLSVYFQVNIFTKFPLHFTWADTCSFWMFSRTSSRDLSRIILFKRDQLGEGEDMRIISWN